MIGIAKFWSLTTQPDASSSARAAQSGQALAFIITGIQSRYGATSSGNGQRQVVLHGPLSCTEVIVYLTLGVLLGVIFVAYVMGMLTAFLLVIQAMLRYKK